MSLKLLLYVIKSTRDNVQFSWKFGVEDKTEKVERFPRWSQHSGAGGGKIQNSQPSLGVYKSQGSLAYKIPCL